MSPRLILLLGILLLATPVIEAAKPGPAEDGWRLDGGATISLDYYDISGDQASSPFPFDGLQSYGQLDLLLEKRQGFRSWRFYFLGLVNDDRYRSPFDGVVPERINLSVQDGTARLPYRIELGDSYGYFTQRTIQTQVKGLQFELQSPLGSPERMQSLQFVSGSQIPSWRDVSIADSWSTGLSWMIQDPLFGSWSANFLDHRDDLELDGTLSRRTQRLYSVAAYVPVRLDGHTIALEGEAGHLRQKFSADDERNDSEDEGYFAQVSGRGRLPFSWRARYEKYGQEYAPAGAPIVPGRRAAEAHVGYRLPPGAEIRGRYIFYRDDHESIRPVDNRTTGFILSGPVWGRGPGSLVVSADVFRQTIHTSDRELDVEFDTVDTEFYTSIAGAWTPRARFFWQDADDRTAADSDRDTRELHLSVGRAVSIGGLSGTLEPGLLFRRIRNGVESSDDWEPTLALNIARGGHLLVQNLGYLSQGRLAATAGEPVDTFTYRALYRYRARHSDLSVEFETYNRRPDQSLDTDTYRLAVAWTYHFDKDAAPGIRPKAPPAPFDATREGPLDLAELVPGSEMQDVLARLARAGLGEPSRLGNLLVYDTPIMAEIFQRQRLLLIERDGKLVQSGLVIEPVAKLLPAAFEEEFERIRQLFINRYGPPARVFDEGEPVPDVTAAINTGDLIRLTEWEIAGSVMRFGIPRRTDGQLRLELQFAPAFPQVRDETWSISDARR